MSLQQVVDLSRFVEEHFEALESDFQHYYGLDLRRVLYGEDAVGLRRLRALIGGLPPGSAVHRSVDPAGYGWRNTEEMLALIAQLIDHTNRLLFARTQKGQVPKPIHIKRPWERVPERRPVASPDEVRAFFKGKT